MSRFISEVVVVPHLQEWKGQEQVSYIGTLSSFIFTFIRLQVIKILILLEEDTFRPRLRIC